MSLEPKKHSLQLDALTTEQALRKRMAEFAQSVAYLRDPRISDICRPVRVKNFETLGEII